MTQGPVPVRCSRDPPHMGLIVKSILVQRLFQLWRLNCLCPKEVLVAWYKGHAGVCLRVAARWCEPIKIY
jgi:hypothetical protein